MLVRMGKIIENNILLLIFLQNILKFLHISFHCSASVLNLSKSNFSHKEHKYLNEVLKFQAKELTLRMRNQVLISCVSFSGPSR